MAILLLDTAQQVVAAGFQGVDLEDTGVDELAVADVVKADIGLLQRLGGAVQFTLQFTERRTAMEQEYFMQQALALAQEAAVHGEVPVGCVIVRNGEIVGRGRNQREEKQAAVSHAEMEAIAQANAALGSWRLDECDLYVTLEPCPMCAGAILNARIRRVYYGARDEVMGACGGVLNLFMEGFPRPPQLVGNVCGDECRDVLQTFFREVREKNGENTNRSADIVEDFTEF